jgi:hypothetical protein
MSIRAIFLFTCEICGHSSATIKDDCGIYDDPVVSPPNDENWDYITTINSWGENIERLACPECIKRKGNIYAN